MTNGLRSASALSGRKPLARIPACSPGAARRFSAYGKAALGGCYGSALERLGFKTAKEILAEVFRIRVSNVEEMIQNRFEAHYEEARFEENGLWPREFRLER
ncbi:MAG: hypothetical protein NTV25_04600 [Methanothrix sp.]|nr:hypothetical protein [Methanothrix sp.]